MSYAVTGVDVQIVDMKFLFIEVESQVYFDSSKISFKIVSSKFSY